MSARAVPARTLPRFEPLATERLVLRPVRTEDAPSLALRRSDPTVAGLQSWDVPYPADAAHSLIDELAALDGVPPGDGWFQVTVTTDDGTIVGDVALHLTFDGRCAELGYTFAREHRRRGYATEATAAMAAWCFETLGVSRVSANMHPDNVASARVAEALGMTYEGTSPAAYWVDHHDGSSANSDDVHYGMTGEQWRAWRDRPLTPPIEVALVGLDPDNVRELLELRTHRSQEDLVSPMSGSLADALGHLSGGDGRVVPWPRAIAADGELVGFVMLAEPTGRRPDTYLWRLLIDRLHQRRGVGRRVLDAVIAQARDWDSPAVTVSWAPGPGSPEPFYRRAGFVPTGKVHDGEIQARLDL